MKPDYEIKRPEFIALMALMTSIMPLAIDSMLPAFPNIGATFDISSPDELQFIIATLFFGFGCGQFVFGPLSDMFGRKRPIYFGFAIFIVGSILSGFAQSYETFLFGRFLQGFGGAAPRIISLALIRDKYAGEAMAQITSMVMTIFILVPAIAPTLGQGILYVSGWRAIFIALFVMGLLMWIWFALRQNETLPKSRRKPLLLKELIRGTKETFSYPVTVASMLVSGLIFGIFIGYLGAVQGLFSNVFGVTSQFPMYFAVLALSIGAASFFNARFVMKLGMRRLIFYAFFSLSIISNLFALYIIAFQEGPTPLWLFMTYMTITFFSVGFLFGNLNAMAMQPLGHIAGIGSSILGFVQSAIAVGVGVTLGHYFHDSVVPLVLSFGTIGLLCILIFNIEKRFS